MAYGDRYILLSSDVFERKFKVQIQEKDYTGITEDLIASGNSPVTIGFEGKGGTNVNKYDPIKALHCGLSVYSLVDFQFMDLFTSDSDKYKIIVSIFENGDYVPYFIGFIEPDIYEEPYVMVPYEVTIRAVDGLVRLKSIKFENTGLNNTESHLNILLYILGLTGLSLNVNFICNIFETNMTASGDPFSQAYNKLVAFIKDDKPKTCYEVLEVLMIVYGCRIVQHKGEWLICRTDEQFESLPQTSRYDSTGAALTGLTYTNIKPFTPARASREDLARSMYSNTMMMVIPSWKSFIINQEFKKHPSIIINYNFEKYTHNLGGFDVPDSWNAVPYIPGQTAFFLITRLGEKVACLFDGRSTVESDVVSLNETDLTLHFLVKMSLAQNDDCRVYLKLTNGTSTYYLKNNGGYYTWSTSTNSLLVSYNGNDKTSELINIYTPKTPITGNISVKFTCVDQFKTAFIKEVDVTIENRGDDAVVSNKEIETLVSDNNYIPSDINVEIGDIPDFPDTEKVYDGGILLSDGTATKEWNDTYADFSGELLLCLAYNMGRQYKTPSLMLQGTFKGFLDFMTTFVDTSNLNRKFVWSHQVEFNVKQAEFNGYMVELLPPPGTRVLGDESDNAIEFETDLLIEV